MYCSKYEFMKMLDDVLAALKPRQRATDEDLVNTATFQVRKALEWVSKNDFCNGKPPAVCDVNGYVSINKGILQEMFSLIKKLTFVPHTQGMDELQRMQRLQDIVSNHKELVE